MDDGVSCAQAAAARPEASQGKPRQADTAVCTRHADAEAQAEAVCCAARAQGQCIWGTDWYSEY